MPFPSAIDKVQHTASWCTGVHIEDGLEILAHLGAAIGPLDLQVAAHPDQPTLCGDS